MSIGERLVELRDGKEVKAESKTVVSERERSYGKTDAQRIASLETKVSFLYFWIFILPFIIWGLFVVTR